jgi:hypothetical protein
MNQKFSEVVLNTHSKSSQLMHSAPWAPRCLPSLPNLTGIKLHISPSYSLIQLKSRVSLPEVLTQLRSLKLVINQIMTTHIITNKHKGLTCVSSPIFTPVFSLRRVLVGFPPLFHLLIFPATLPFIYPLYFLILSSPDPFVYFFTLLKLFLFRMCTCIIISYFIIYFYGNEVIETSGRLRPL